MEEGAVLALLGWCLVFPHLLDLSHMRFTMVLMLGHILVENVTNSLKHNVLLISIWGKRQSEGENKENL